MSIEGGSDRTQQLLDALSSPVRREILWLVWDRELSAGEISSAFAQGAPTISSHLAVLRASGLVTMTRDGTFRRYRARQEEVRALRGLLGPRGGASARLRPEGEPQAASRMAVASVAEVVAPCSPHDAFRAFTDAALYSRWAGVPVTIEDGRFSLTMEWGLQVRGRYEAVYPPRLVLMRWDFADDTVPLPGEAERGYLEVWPDEGGSRVTVVQLSSDERTGQRMQRAWALMLGRFRDRVADALDPACEMPVRSPRAG